jgi:hypothetical protein
MTRTSAAPWGHNSSGTVAWPLAEPSCQISIAVSLCLPHHPGHALIDETASGRQTGADRDALDWAIENLIPHRGWCPKGRLAEDGPIPPRYNLTEAPNSNNPQRTELNAPQVERRAARSLRS